ncbi:MAG: hypothetical protein M1501_00670 [Candidatus Omnitrophica bacterium]|nr:hypothetical protein [Candidatus Omnitrophota bacterium]
MEYVKQQNKYFVFCEPKIQKAVNEESLEKIQDNNNFFCYEKIDEELYQVFILPVSVIDKIKKQTELSKTVLIPYQTSVRNLLTNSEPALFLHALDDTTLIMTGIKGKEVSQATPVPIKNIKETVKFSINDYKTTFRLESMSVITNSRDIAEQLEGIEVKTISFPHALPVQNTPEFILPQHIEFKKTEAENKQIRMIGGTAVFGVLLAVAIFYQNRTGLTKVIQQRNMLQKKVTIMQTAYTNYQQQDTSKYFSSRQKNKMVSLILKLSHLPPGYTFKNLKIKRMPSGNYMADVFISIAAPGMSSQPLRILFPEGIIDPVFQNQGQIYRIRLGI